MPEKAPVINPKPTVARAVWIVFIVVTPLLGPRAAAALSNIVPETKNAALADQLTHASFASKQCHHSFRQLLSTDQRQSGILVNVHSASSFEGIAQHNQLLRFRSNGLLPSRLRKNPLKPAALW